MRLLVRNWWAPLLLLALVAPGFLPAARANTLILTVASDPVNLAPGDSLLLYGTVAQSESHLLGGFGGNMGPLQCGQFDCGQGGFDPAFVAFVTGPQSSALTLYSGPLFNLSAHGNDRVQFLGLLEYVCFGRQW